MVDDAALRPMPATLWHPPAHWRKGETVVVETVALVPAAGLCAGPDGVERRADGRRRPDAALPVAPAPTARRRGTGRGRDVAPDGSLRLPGLARRDGQVEPYEGALYPLDTADATFSGQDWSVRLREWSAPVSARPAANSPCCSTGRQAGPRRKTTTSSSTSAMRPGRPSPWATGNRRGSRPGPRPAGRQEPTAWRAIDAHAIDVPADLAPGTYELVVGWYDWKTGKRLSRTAGRPGPWAGNRVGDEFVLGASDGRSAGRAPPRRLLPRREGMLCLAGVTPALRAKETRSLRQLRRRGRNLVCLVILRWRLPCGCTCWTRKACGTTRPSAHRWRLRASSS